MIFASGYTFALSIKHGALQALGLLILGIVIGGLIVGGKRPTPHN